MSKRQHHKSKKRPRSWHRSGREDKYWLARLERLEQLEAHARRRLR